MPTVVIITMIIAIILYCLLKQTYIEGMDNTEAVQNVASLYNTGLFTGTNLTCTGKLSVAGSVDFLPKGIVVPYYPPSSWNNVAPAGWLLCDGTQGTPDLRGRFIFGYDQRDTTNTNNAISLTGGEKAHTLTANEMPSHTHTYTQATWGGGDTAANNGGSWGQNANHVQTNSAGGGAAHNIMPPYYVLVYIMRSL